MEIIDSATLAGEAVRLMRMLYLAGRDKSICLGSNKLHFQVLYVLCDRPPPGLTMSQLSEALLVSPQQLSRLISSMEGGGLVRREHDSGNRRLVYVQALPAGRREMDKVIEETRGWIAAQLAIFSDEDMLRLHECFVFISRLLEKSVMKQSLQDPDNLPVQEERINENIC
jgi:DNA-binding MarR family transcriptional regulator